MAAAAHTQAMSDRGAGRDIDESHLDRTRALLALGGDAALQALCRSCELSRRGARLLGKLKPGEPEHPGTLSLECRKPSPTAVCGPVAHARHKRG